MFNWTYVTCIYIIHCSMGINFIIVHFCRLLNFQFSEFKIYLGKNI